MEMQVVPVPAPLKIKSRDFHTAAWKTVLLIEMLFFFFNETGGWGGGKKLLMKKVHVDFKP